MSSLPAERLQQLQAIAHAHFPGVDQQLLDKLCELHEEQCRFAEDENLPLPSTAEFLDAVRACTQLELKADSEPFRSVASLAMWKHAVPPGPMVATAEQPRR